MSEYQVLAILAGFAFLYSLVASRLEKTPINGAVVYLFVGLACGSYGLGWIDLAVDMDGLKSLSEFTLALVLFSDSANANLGVVRRNKWIPIRLLLIGLPLTIVAGFGAGYVIFPSLSLIEVALLATMLAPTDAALGQAVVTNKLVPGSVRESLNVESGLNDGICVPVLLVFLALATGELTDNQAAGLITQLPLQQIGIGVAVGLAMACAGSAAVRISVEREWISDAWVQVPVVALALLCFSISQWWGGSGFIACFVGGLVFGGLTESHKHEVLNGAEGVGDVLSMLTWFTFGAVALGPCLQHFSWQILAYAVLSLTAVRMVPVLVCVFGVPMHLDTKLFVGWFGPRGLASIVFVVMVIHEQLPGNDTLTAAVTWTVSLSIIAHGISAVPLAKWYGRRASEREKNIES